MGSAVFKKLMRSKSLQGSLAQMEFLQATKWSEVEGAFGLLYGNYLERGLIDENPHRLRFTHFNLLEESGTFIARVGNRVVATLSVVTDGGAFGLPMDELYRAELNAMRRNDKCPAEGSGLAVANEYRAIGVYIVMNLVKMAINYAQHCGATTAVIACHPKHAKFYEDVFLFEPFGTCRTYGAVNGALAVALKLELDGLEQRYRQSCGVEGPGIYRYFFTDEFFECSDMLLRKGAFSRRTCRELLQIRPDAVFILEQRAPGLVESLTGWGSAWVKHRLAERRSSGNLELTPAFVAA